jgi:hypothetical protein
VETTVPTAEAHIIVRYDPNLDAECRLHYDDDGNGQAVLVITFGDQTPADVALMQIRAVAAPYYEPEQVAS